MGERDPLLSSEELKGLLNKATPGPWRAARNTNGVSCLVDMGTPPNAPFAIYHTDAVPPNHENDTALIALAPSLASEVIALRERVEKLESELASFKAVGVAAGDMLTATLTQRDAAERKLAEIATIAGPAGAWRGSMRETMAGALDQITALATPTEENPS